MLVGPSVVMEWEMDEEKEERFLLAAQDQQQAPARRRRAGALVVVGCLAGCYAAVPVVRVATSTWAAASPPPVAALDETVAWKAECYTAVDLCRSAAGGAPALDGADVVSYFDEGRHAAGSSEHREVYGGSEYWFASVEHRHRFAASPEAFVPRLGGFCAYALTGDDREGQICELSVDTVDPTVFYVSKAGGLYLYKGTGAKKNMGVGDDVEDALRLAEDHWRVLLASTPADAALVNSDSAACVDAVQADFAALTDAAGADGWASPSWGGQAAG